MILGIDASRSQDKTQKTGVEVISDELLCTLSKKLEQQAIQVRYYTPTHTSWLPKEVQRILRLPRLWTSVRLSIEMLLHKPDVFFSPVHELPFFVPKKTFRIIHDVAFLRSPKSYSAFQNWYLRFGLKRSIKHCSKLFVATEQVKKDLLALTNARDKQVVVTGFGYERKNKSDYSAEKKKQLFFVGRIETKKNLSNLIKAFELFSQSHPDFTLLLAGKDGHGAEEIKSQTKESSANIELLGYISNEDKFEILSESMALVHVARQEGFGIPMLEAFDHGTAVITSDLPVLREVGQEAAIYVDPALPENIAQGITKVVGDAELRAKLIHNGQDRLHDYQWDSVADEMLKLLLRTCSRSFP